MSARRLPEAVILEAVAHGAPRRRRRLRTELGRALERADLRLRGTSPSEILLVRSLHARAAESPAPTAAVGAAATAGSPAALTLRQGESVRLRGQLTSLRAAAVRPVRGRVPAGAAAVLFDDDAELTAVLALVRAEGGGADPWWHRGAGRCVPGLLQAPALGPALCAHAARLPAVVCSLDAWGATDTVFAGLPGSAIRDLAAAIAEAFQVPVPTPAAGGGPALDDTSRPASPARDRHRVASDSDPAQAARFGLLTALRSLHRRPGLARDPGFRDWLAGIALGTEPSAVAAGPAGRSRPRPPWLAPTSQGPAPPTSPVARGDGTAQRRPAAAPAEGQAGRALPPALATDTSPLPHVERAADRPADWAGAAPSAPAAPNAGPGQSQAPRSPAEEGPSPMQMPSGVRTTPQPRAWTTRPPRDVTPPSAIDRPGARSAGDPSARGAPDATADARTGSLRAEAPKGADDSGPGAVPRSAPSSRSHLAAPSCTQTRLGGMFFLWRLIDALDLPDAAADWRMPEALAGWALLEAVARAVLDPMDASCASDPIWPLLARLDGRGANAIVGADMVTPAMIRVPAAWLRSTPELADRLQAGSVASEALAASASAPGSSGPGSPASALPANRTDAPTWMPSSPLSHWLAAFGPVLRERLALALDCRPAAVLPLLHLAADVHVSPSHVDVVARLEDAAGPVRRAGLDIDPGWVPALGRVVLFHYT